MDSNDFLLIEAWQLVIQESGADPGSLHDERKAVLDALREELRKRDYLPILFDFDVPATRDITETVSLLARMARFIIADLTDPSSIPKELEAIVPHLAVPVQPLLEGSSRPYAMFKDYWKYDWVLPVYRYEGLEPLLATLAEKVIAPAEGKVKALQERRRMIEAELTKPRRAPLHGRRGQGGARASNECPEACPVCCGTALIRSGHACGRQRWRCKGRAAAGSSPAPRRAASRRR